MVPGALAAVNSSRCAFVTRGAAIHDSIEFPFSHDVHWLEDGSIVMIVTGLQVFLNNHAYLFVASADRIGYVLAAKLEQISLGNVTTDLTAF